MIYYIKDNIFCKKNDSVSELINLNFKRLGIKNKLIHLNFSHIETNKNQSS